MLEISNETIRDEEISPKLISSTKFSSFEDAINFVKGHYSFMDQSVSICIKVYQM